jgi:hypothetical protein
MMHEDVAMKATWQRLGFIPHTVCNISYATHHAKPTLSRNGSRPLAGRELKCQE